MKKIPEILRLIFIGIPVFLIVYISMELLFAIRYLIKKL